MKRLRLILIVALAAVVLGAVAAYWLNPPVQLPTLDPGGAEGPSDDGKPRVKGLTYTHVKDGQRKWTLKSDGARFDEVGGKVNLSKVDLVFYREGGGWITLQGIEGVYDQKNKVVTLKGDVEGQTNDGNTLNTEVLTYYEQDQVVETDAEVTLSGPRWTVRGKGMRVVVPESRITFKHDVHSIFTPMGAGPPPGATMDAPPEEEQGDAN